MAEEIAKQIESGSNAIVDVMIESNFRSGRQYLKRSYNPIYGQSITDACLSIEETLPIFHKLDEAVTRGRFGRKKSCSVALADAILFSSHVDEAGRNE